jgi:hypothetical protein
MWVFRGRGERTLVPAQHDDGDDGAMGRRRAGGVCCDTTIGDSQMHAIPLETVLSRLMRCVVGFGPRAV